MGNIKPLKLVDAQRLIQGRYRDGWTYEKATYAMQITQEQWEYYALSALPYNTTLDKLEYYHHAHAQDPTWSRRAFKELQWFGYGRTDIRQAFELSAQAKPIMETADQTRRKALLRFLQVTKQRFGENFGCFIYSDMPTAIDQSLIGLCQTHTSPEHVAQHIYLHIHWIAVMRIPDFKMELLLID